MSVEAARNVYRTLQRASGLTPGQFSLECGSVTAETCTERDRETLPGDWLNAAREVAYYALTKKLGKAKGEQAYFAAELAAFGRAA